jgi:PAS domain S-box-containing protein
MNEITAVALDNEMDLILAHKQSLRLAELTGLSLPAQTSFATAVSEVSRYAFGTANQASLKLYVSEKADRNRFLMAVLEDQRPDYSTQQDEGYSYARKLVTSIRFTQTDATNRLELHYRLPSTTRIDDQLVEQWRIQLNTDPAVSPYEEIKRKNRHLAELADRLRDSEAQYKTLTDSLPIMIFTLDAGWERMLYANQWLLDYTGKPLEVIDRAAWQQLIHPDDIDQLAAVVPWKQAHTPHMVTVECRLRERNSGAYRWHTGVASAIFNKEGELSSWNTFMVDIHAQKMVEQTLKDNRQLQEIRAELEEKIALLDRSNQQLEQFANITSHDLQEPLRKISFYSDYLRSKFGHVLPEEATGFFDKLIGATDRMKVLVQDILAYSTVQQDAFVAVELDEVVRESLNDLEITIRETGARVDLKALPVVMGNRRQLKQLFDNLLSNGIKFSDASRLPELSVSASVADNRAVLYFKDNGIGFENQYVDKMFELFQRLHTKDKYTGTGIGLAICKKIVELHKGSIEASGRPGTGALFTVYLPLADTSKAKAQ